MKWEKQRFGDVIDFNPRVSLEKGVEYPYLPMDEIQPGRKFNQPSNTRVYKSGGARFANNDTVLARITPCLENGKVSKIAHLEGGLGFGSTEYFVFRAIEGKTDPDYIYYLAASDIVRQPAIKSMVGASGRQRADRGVVENLMIPFPDVETQKYIAGILSAYDDLIDNNNRRIALLEEAIHRLYREWFVHLRFPGHEHTAVVAGVPVGWEKRPLAKLLDYHIGGGWGKDEYTEGYTDLAYVFRGTDIPKLKSGDTNSVPLRFHTTSNLASRKIQAGDLILEVSNGRIENVGRTLLVTRQLLEAFPEPVMCASFCKLLRTKANYPSFLLMLHIEQMNESGELGYFKNPSAAGINNFRFKDFLTNAEILVPGTKIMADVKEFLEPQILMITNLRTQIRKLQEARDALLPRLMNGSLPV